MNKRFIIRNCNFLIISRIDISELLLGKLNSSDKVKTGSILNCTGKEQNTEKNLQGMLLRLSYYVIHKLVSFIITVLVLIAISFLR